MKKARDKALEQMKQSWQQSPLYGQYPERAHKADFEKVNRY